MKIITIDLPDSYLQLLEKENNCPSLNIPNHIRLQIREDLRQELILAGELGYEPLKKKSVEFFNSCMNCGRRIYNKEHKNHLFYKNIEVFMMKFCCFCYDQFKGIAFEDFPLHIIDNIRKGREEYKKSPD
jgi:hypothetical protein